MRAMVIVSVLLATGAGAGCSDGGSATACPAAAVAWGWNGGQPAYVERSEVAGCAGFALTRSAAAVSSCSGTLPSATQSALADALEDPDVAAALAAAPALYGADPRPVDGAVLQVEVDGRQIEIGIACPAPATGCTPIPPGVAALAAVLQDVTEEVRAAEPSCAPLR